MKHTYFAQLLRSTKSKITESENGQNVPYLEILK